MSEEKKEYRKVSFWTAQSCQQLIIMSSYIFLASLVQFVRYV